MTESDHTIIEHRLDAEGADHLLLAGVNDANMQALSQEYGIRVILRGDHLILSGEVERLERAVPLIKHLIELARLRAPFDTGDIARLAREFEDRGEGAPTEAAEDAPRIALPGNRRAIAARSRGQQEYLQAMHDNDLVISIGPAGTGKTYLAVAAAVDALYRKRVRKIVLARPAVEAGENLGFLPGDLQEKVDPYLRPLYDALDDMIPAERLARSLDDRTIEIAPLAYMRGRTLSDAFVILDEAQNATSAQMKMFLTRLGLNSQVVITGDKTQIDLPASQASGLLEIERILRGIDGIRFIYLEGGDVVRHRLVRDIIAAYARAEDEADEEAELEEEAPGGRHALEKPQGLVEALDPEALQEAEGLEDAAAVPGRSRSASAGRSSRGGEGSPSMGGGARNRPQREETA